MIVLAEVGYVVGIPGDCLRRYACRRRHSRTGGSMRVQVGDGTLFFDVAGAKLVPDGHTMRERPTLVLVAGGPGGDHSWFKPILDPLTAVAQVLYLDLRGHGRSDPGTPAHWTLASWADDIAAFCDAVAVSAPVVMGLSWGVAVVGTYAARHPEQPGKLILCAGVSRTAPHIELAAVERIAGPAVLQLGERFFTDPTPVNENAYDEALQPFRSGMDPEDRRAAMARIRPCAPGLRALVRRGGLGQSAKRAWGEIP